MNLANLVGRRGERETLERLVAEARSGRSGALVVRGEPGIGKTALLAHAREAAVASGFRVESAVAVESEMQFAFAGLHQLCALIPDRGGALPDPQQTALDVAFGVRAGATPDRFLVGLASLNLLSAAAETQPLLCLVDDAQWLDQPSAQVLAFVARRLAAEHVVLIFGMRETAETDKHPLAGLPELRLRGLGDADARALLASATHQPVDDAVRDRIVAESRGNPLALLELPRNARPSQLAGGFELPAVLDLPQRIENSFLDRSADLPTPTQMLLLTAAAEPTGEPDLLWRAAAELRLGSEAAAPAEAAGLVEIGTHVRFRHPLVRSAVYRAAAPSDRRRVHSALAAVIDPQSAPDRHAWHRAQAFLGTDERVAEMLEESAGRARARGGQAAAAAFLQKAAELTPVPAERANRALAAAHAKLEAGAPEAALELLSTTSAGPLDARQRARVKLLRAEIDFHLARGHDVPGMLLEAATALAPLEPALARETYLHALDTAIITGGTDHVRGVAAVAEAARSAPAPPVPPRPADLLLDGLVTTYTRGYAAGVPELRHALQAFCHDGPTETADDGADRRWLWLASRTALLLFDEELVHQLTDRNVRLARDAGALSTLPAALLFRAVLWVLTGEQTRASEFIAEEAAVKQLTGAVTLRFGQLLRAAWRGHETETIEVHTAAVQEATARGNRAEVSLAHYSMAVLHNGLGNYADALEAAKQACASYEPPHTSLALPELVEAASRADRPEGAEDALEELSVRSRATGTPWALGVAARSQALTSTGSAAEAYYREAIAHLSESRMAVYLARTHLVYGEWLRRERRRQDAREHLRTAHELLRSMGADAFAARAARELRATGEHPRRRTAQPADALTDHELHIARLVATGATSKEIAAQLFLSPRTIEAHLRNIFRKLGVTSRRQLRQMEFA